MMECTWPGSFVILGESAHGQLSLPTAAYFSFVALATLGYGDVVPVSEAARSLVVFEAIAGQLYLAVTVATLGSLYVLAERCRVWHRSGTRSYKNFLKSELRMWEPNYRGAWEAIL